LGEFADSLRSEIQVLAAHGKQAWITAGMNMELAVKTAQMCPRRIQRNAQLICDLLVGQSLRDKLQDFSLARSQ